jgi:hypothetical protein
MPIVRYNIGKARRYVAGNLWCAERSHQGKLPCLRCRGRGTLPGASGARVGCPDCGVSGNCNDPVLWKCWYKLWVYTQVTRKAVDGALFHS